MKIYNFLISGLLLFGCSFTNVQAAELSGKCPAGPALVKSESKRLGDNVYHADHYCIMSKRPGKGQISGLISGEQADSVTSRYISAFKRLQTDQERVIFIDEFISRFSRKAWLTVFPISEDFSGLSISAQRYASSTDTQPRLYRLGVNLFQGMHQTLIPKLDDYVAHERAYAEVPKHIAALVHYVITGTTTAELEDSQETQWENDQDYENWAEEQADGTCERFNQNEGAECDHGWVDDDDTGERWIRFWDNLEGVWDGYHYFRYQLIVRDPFPPVFIPY